MKNKSYLAIMLLVVTSLVMAGCATTASPTPPAAASTAASVASPVPATQAAAASSNKNTQFIMGLLAEPETYFPGFESSALASYCFQLVFNELVTTDPEGKIVSDLAQSWDLSADQLTWTFHLVPNVKWQDGQPFSAKDVQFTIEMLADPKYTGTYYSMIAPIVGAEDKHDGKATSISGINVIDDNTIAFTTVAPNSLLLQTMASVMPILPEHILKGIAVADLANSPFSRAPIGTGPYALKEWKSQASLTFTANPDYFKGAPKINTVILDIIPEPSAEITALLNGEINFIYGISADNFPQLKSSSVVETLQIPGNAFYSLNYHITDPLLADVRVRQAIAHSIDKKALLDGVSGGLGKVENSIFFPTLPEYDPNLTGYTYDVNMAKDLLKQAGWTNQDANGILEAKGVAGVADGTKFTIELGTRTTAPYVQFNQILQQDLKAIGIDATIKSMDTNTYWSTYYVSKGPWQLTGTGWSNLIGSPQQELLWNLTCDSQSQFDYCNKDFDQLVAKNNSIFDDTQRAQNFYTIEQMIEQQALYVPLFRPDNLIAYTKGLVMPKVNSTFDIYRNISNFSWGN
jgi:peptide/nickel transport system substrate-binding protein